MKPRCKEATKNQMARWRQYCFSGRSLNTYRQKGLRKIKLKREASCHDRSSNPHLPKHSILSNSQTPMSSITESCHPPPASADASSLTQPGTVNPRSTDSGSILTGTEPPVSFPKRLYDAWKAGLGPTYGINNERGDRFMKLFDAQPLKIDLREQEEADDSRRRDRLKRAFLLVCPSGEYSWTTEQHKEFADHVVRPA